MGADRAVAKKDVSIKVDTKAPRAPRAPRPPRPKYVPSAEGVERLVQQAVEQGHPRGIQPGPKLDMVIGLLRQSALDRKAREQAS